MISFPRRLPFAVLFVIAAFCFQALPYTYTAWTTMTGAKTFAVNPFFYGDFADMAGTGADVVVGYGLTDKMDIFANAATLSPIKDFEYGGSWIMPRYALKENHIVALQLGTDAENLTLAPQYHFVKDGEKAVLELNAVLSLNSADFSAGSVWATCGGVYKLVPDVLYPFLEFNPSLDYGEEALFDFNLAPGVWFGIKDTPHQFALSFPISGIKDGDVSAGFNLWYWWSFTMGGAAE